MTMPDERARSLKWMGEFLADCARLLPEDLAAEAKNILTHYPSAQEIQARAEQGGWLGAKAPTKGPGEHLSP